MTSSRQGILHRLYVDIERPGRVGILSKFSTIQSSKITINLAIKIIGSFRFDNELFVSRSFQVAQDHLNRLRMTLLGFTGKSSVLDDSKSDIHPGVLLGRYRIIPTTYG